MPYQGAAQETGLLYFADRRAAVESIISYRFDGIEHGQTAPAEHLQVYAEAAIHHFYQQIAFGKEGSRARDQILHQAHVALIEAPFDDVAPGKTLRHGGTEGNVNHPDFQDPSATSPEDR